MGDSDLRYILMLYDYKQDQLLVMQCDNTMIVVLVFTSAGQYTENTVYRDIFIKPFQRYWLSNIPVMLA